MNNENLKTQPESVPDFVADLFALASKMRKAGVPDGWDTEVHAIAVSLAEGLGIEI